MAITQALTEFTYNQWDYQYKLIQDLHKLLKKSSKIDTAFTHDIGELVLTCQEFKDFYNNFTNHFTIYSQSNREFFTNLLG